MIDHWGVVPGLWHRSDWDLGCTHGRFMYFLGPELECIPSWKHGAKGSMWSVNLHCWVLSVLPNASAYFGCLPGVCTGPVYAVLPLNQPAHFNHMPGVLLCTNGLRVDVHRDFYRLCFA